MTKPKEANGTDGIALGRVLYVGAEETMRRRVQTALEAFGFSVLLARDSRRGVASFREHADQLRLVILDLDLPEQSAEKALQEIRRLRPMARILLLSGEPDDAVRTRFAGMEWVDVLPKPFHFVEFIEHVQAACGKRRYARLNVSLPVSAWPLETPGPELQGRLHRVAEGGLEVELPEAVVPGTPLGVRLHTRRGPIELTGKVVFSRATETTVRHGLAFFQPKDSHFVLDLFLHERW